MFFSCHIPFVFPFEPARSSYHTDEPNYCHLQHYPNTIFSVVSSYGDARVTTGISRSAQALAVLSSVWWPWGHSGTRFALPACHHKSMSCPTLAPTELVYVCTVQVLFPSRRVGIVPAPPPFFFHWTPGLRLGLCTLYACGRLSREIYQYSTFDWWWCLPSCSYFQRGLA